MLSLLIRPKVIHLSGGHCNWMGLWPVTRRIPFFVESWTQVQWLKHLFLLFRSSNPPSVNFTNLIRAAFALISFVQKITSPNFKQIKAALNTFLTKKLLIKCCWNCHLDVTAERPIDQMILSQFKFVHRERFFAPLKHSKSLFLFHFNKFDFLVFVKLYSWSRFVNNRVIGIWVKGYDTDCVTDLDKGIKMIIL